MKDFGLVLTGGGARGAYQAGVLKAISEILQESMGEFPFRVLSGSSAGAINCSFLVCHEGSFMDRSQSLADLWSGILFSDIFKTDTSSLGTLGFKWAKGLSFAGIGVASAPNYLLDTAPLGRLIRKNIDFSNLFEFEKKGGALAINATHCHSGAAITFYSDSRDMEAWMRSRRLAVPSRISADHVLASSAIPLLFPPVKVHGAYYLDGALRMRAPYSPAIHLGARKILSIGVKKKLSEAEFLSKVQSSENTQVQLSDIAGVLLNSVFLDSLDDDLERLERINDTLEKCRFKDSDDLALKPVEVLNIQPSEDLGAVARPTLEYFPKTVRYLLSGIGADEKSGSDLLSYLSFHPSYTKQLIDIGYNDASRVSEEIFTFFHSIEAGN